MATSAQCDEISTEIENNPAVSLSRDEAKSLLAMFSLGDSNTGTRSAVLMFSPPNGENLYVAPYHSYWSSHLPG